MVKKSGGTDKTRQDNNKGDAMVFGDNVRARKAARALPRTPATRRRRGKKGDREDEQRSHTLTHTAIPYTTTHHNKTKHALSSHTAITIHTPLRCTPQHG